MHCPDRFGVRTIPLDSKLDFTRRRVFVEVPEQMLKMFQLDFMIIWKMALNYSIDANTQRSPVGAGRMSAVRRCRTADQSHKKI